MLYSDWPSSDRYYKTLESSKWSVDMLTAPNHLTEHARQIDSIFANFCRRCPKYVPQGKISDWRKLISD
ncbi:hypothetical protein EAO28_07675 [Klebsiella pneumoniae]|uniref:Uncharacterized protein n=1 Tax=Klebsiella pneumoniae TaxID=573 RepID=A0A3P2G1N0_KLEPN|nr:hypothetical protein EAN86_24415 [Klebsiella pneumoniae]RRE43355.1 hypothetical protein EAO28_07675 [Klebsiella pneumoniae]RRE62193.1 hypothetical protein EAO01_09175 [Klebsiella pneumoniae]